MIAARSAITPNTGLVRATIEVEIAIPRLHIELPVKVKPKNTASFPKASLNKMTKYKGTIAAVPLVAKAELAQSYIHQARIIFRFLLGKSRNFVEFIYLIRPASRLVDKANRAHTITSNVRSLGLAVYV